jgi:secreted Zn-dependent insulinase-like peptidase
MNNNIDINNSKPSCDKKSYRLIILSNGLEVLLISSKELNKEASKSAASLCVQVGSFADPIEAEGCAHFLEHMVFMGSKKYPEENYYDSFITSHGGNCNAYTEGEYTVYQFDVSSEYFDNALDIFAQCFISPILSMSSSEREIKAIESEFKLALNSDESRLQQLFCYNSKKNHVLNKFSWGNYDSLHTKPSSLGVDMQDLLLRFHATHYHPKSCKLVVLDIKSLDEIEQDVRNSFNQWNPIPLDEECPMLISLDDVNEPLLKMAKIETSVIAPLPTINECLAPYKSMIPFDETSLGVIKRIVPFKKCHKVVIHWTFPSSFPTYKKAVDRYLCNLCGHEGPGSLLSVLKEKSYATYKSLFYSNNIRLLYVRIFFFTRVSTKFFYYVNYFVKNYKLCIFIFISFFFTLGTIEK